MAAPEPVRTEPRTPTEAQTPLDPRTPTEALVAQVWRELLELGDFDLSEDFFALGGHSMLAVQVVYELQQRTGVPLELASFFDLATVPEVAAELDRIRAGDPGAAASLVEEGEL